MAQRKRYKEPAVNSNGVISPVLIWCLNPISKYEEWPKIETYHLKVEKREERVRKANQWKRSKIKDIMRMEWEFWEEKKKKIKQWMKKDEPKEIFTQFTL